METGSILIKESVNALQNIRQGVSKCFGAKVLKLRGLKEFIEVYIDNKVYSLSYTTYIHIHTNIYIHIYIYIYAYIYVCVCVFESGRGACMCMCVLMKDSMSN